jgi:proline iminopeptidase
MKQLFPQVEAFKTERLKVSATHELYLEQAGNPAGKPIVFLHGGPGAGIQPRYRRYFDPAFYRTVLFDQRGAGKSTPHASLEDNTTWHLVEDMEVIRKHLGIDKWVLFGGSWGSTLALAYAQTYPASVVGLILRGIFLCRPEEIRWFYQEGAHWIFPDEWARYIGIIPEAERGDLVKAYYKRLTSSNEATRVEAARAWSRWEGATVKLIPNPATIHEFEEDQFALSLARTECHFFNHHSFFEARTALLSNMHKINHLPGTIVHGRYDVVCPVKNAFDLHALWPRAKLEVIADAGHLVDEPGITDALLRATEEFKSLFPK